MAGTVHALLLKPEEHGGVRSTLPLVPLLQGSGLALLPLTDEVVASLGGADGDVAVDGFYDLTVGVAGWARRRSRDGVVAYLHVESFGGAGFHAAVAWLGAAVAWGPLFTATAADEADAQYAVVADGQDMAVNVLLRWLGVNRADGVDEFAAAGLNRYRWTQEWAAQVARRPW